MTLTTKTLDDKGRVTLGSQFAGQTVVIDLSDPDCILIKRVEMIPTREAWLYKNDTAIGLIRKGLDEARRGAFSDSTPDVEADLNWLDDVDD